MEWELCKENYQPLRSGRDPAKLAQTTATPLPGTSVEEQRRELWRDVENYDGPDPLEPWLRLLKWTQEQFKSSGRQAETLSLLERCTRELRDKDNYKDDIRYLRVWIQYADCLPEPKDVFLFLTANNIGQDLALFYIAYAAYLELRGNFAKAEAVFEAGQKKMAMPLPKLLAKFDAFRERMERRRRRLAAEGEDSAAPANDDPAAPARAALGVLGSRNRAGGLRRPRDGGADGPRAALGVAPDAKENVAAGGLEVLVDDEFRGGDAGASSSCLGGGCGAGWADLGSFESTRKENEQRASKWKGSKLKQAKALMPQPDPQLDIPEDEDLQGVEPVYHEAPQALQRVRSAHSRLQGTLQQRKGGGRSPRDLEEKLRVDPLRLFKESSNTSRQHAHVHDESLAGPQQQQAGTTPPEDVSFEEVRALAWHAKASCRRHPLSGEPSPAQSMLAPDTSVASRSMEPASAACNSCAPERAAFVRERTRRQSGGLSDVTVATRAAMDSVSGMWRGALLNDVAWGGPAGDEPGPASRLAEPTVTLSSRAAFEAVNSMFQAALPHDVTADRRRSAALSEPRSRGRTCQGSGRRSLAAPDADQTSGFQIYEDTELLLGRRRMLGARSSGDRTDALAPLEDTELLTGPVAGADDRSDAYQDTDFLSRRSSAAGQRARSDRATEFFVYEDSGLLRGAHGEADR